MDLADSPEGRDMTFQVGHRGALQGNSQGNSYNGSLRGSLQGVNGAGLQGVSQGDCWASNDWRQNHNQCNRQSLSKILCHKTNHDLINNSTDHNQDHLLQELSEYGQLGVRGASQIIQVLNAIHHTSFSRCSSSLLKTTICRF